MTGKDSLVENFGRMPIDVVDSDGVIHTVEPGGYLVCEVQQIEHGNRNAHYTVRPYYGEDGGIAVPKSVADEFLR